MNGTLEFIDTGNIAMSNVVEHGGMTDVEWDPTGRYVTTAISYWSQKVGREKWAVFILVEKLQFLNFSNVCAVRSVWRPTNQYMQFGPY